MRRRQDDGAGPWSLLRTIALLGVLMLMTIPVGCGDDDDGGGGGDVNPGDTGYQDLLDDEMTSMGEIGQTALTQSGMNVLFHEDAQGLLPSLFPAIGGFLAKASASADADDLLRTLARAPQELREDAKAAADLGDWYGTYEYQIFEEMGEDPFYRWVLVSPQPDDGFIFQFGEGDGFYDFLPDGTEVEHEGELRFLDIAIDVGDELDPEDDILTNLVFELAAQPVVTEGEAPTLVRVPFAMELDAERFPSSLTIGGAEANDPADNDAAFFGPLVFYLGFGYDGTDVEAVLQLYDSVGQYALRLSLLLEGVDIDAQSIDAALEAATFAFGFGETTNPALPPWVLSVTLSDFTTDAETEEVLATVAGSITYEGRVAATMQGDTSMVPFDWDGNGTADPYETCLNVDITFTDNPTESMSICAAFEELQGLFDLVGGALAMISMQ